MIGAILAFVQRERVFVLKPRPGKTAPVGADKKMSVRPQPVFALVLQIGGIDARHEIFRI